MRHAATLSLALLLSACASPPAVQVDPTLFVDTPFSAPTEGTDVRSIFAVDEDMKRYLRQRGAGKRPDADRARWLFDALYDRGELKLEYDTAATRNASEAFRARAGNCLSLVIMTAALAKDMGLQVRYQNVQIEETWSRQGGLVLSFAHVNLTLGERTTEFNGSVMMPESMTIDFLPPKQLPKLRAKDISEDTVVAMYFNNRAVEALASGRIDDAYALSRAAIEHAPELSAAYNTLALAYRQRKAPELAERTLQALLARKPDDVLAVSNMGLLMRDQGRAAEAHQWAQRLHDLQPNPPYALFDRGRAAMDAGDVETARDLFAKEVDRAPYEHEFRYWLAMAELQLGHVDVASRELAKARDVSTTRNERDLYSAKLQRLKKVLQ